MSKRLVALMPMRHDSERVPGKNYRPFADGRPLYQHVLDSLLASRFVETVVIDTDSPTIREQCATSYPGVVLLERPEHLRDGETPMTEVLLHDTASVPADFYVQTHSTNPLVRTRTFDQAIDAFFKNTPACDSLFSVTPFKSRLWDQLTRAVNHNPDILLRTQDLPPLYEENSCIYIFSRAGLNERRSRIGHRPFMFEMSPWEAVDIDDEIDFKFAELAFGMRDENAC
jgi:CMP-N-acetylneuraminic acid synthetase